MTTVHIDFETRSTVDLRKTGVDVYADDPTTGVWCMAWAIDDRPVQITDNFEIPPTKLMLALSADDTVCVAHNVAFELAIWNRILVPRFDWPVLDYHKVEDTMVMAYAMALPASLDQAAKALKLSMEKDSEGHALMMRMARPRRIEEDGTIVWWDVEERKERLFAYCKQDVEVERELHKRLIRLSPAERQVWQLDYEINQRGVPIDMESVRRAITVEGEVRRDLNRELSTLTRHMVSSATSIEKLLAWIQVRAEQLEKEMVRA